MIKSTQKTYDRVRKINTKPEQPESRKSSNVPKIENKKVGIEVADVEDLVGAEAAAVE